MEGQGEGCLLRGPSEALPLLLPRPGEPSRSRLARQISPSEYAFPSSTQLPRVPLSGMYFPQQRASHGNIYFIHRVDTETMLARLKYNQNRGRRLLTSHIAEDYSRADLRLGTLDGWPWNDPLQI